MDFERNNRNSTDLRIKHDYAFNGSMRMIDSISKREQKVEVLSYVRSSRGSWSHLSIPQKGFKFLNSVTDIFHPVNQKSFDNLETPKNNHQQKKGSDFSRIKNMLLVARNIL